MNRLVVIIFVFACLSPIRAQQYDSDAVERNRMAKARVKAQTQYTHDYVDGKPSAQGYKSSVTQYNNKGDATEITNYNEEGKVISLILYQYDNKGNKTSYERYQGNREKLQYSQKTAYDAKGNKARENGFDGASLYNNTYKYDAADKLIEISYTVDNALVEKRTLSYSGNKTIIKIFNASNVLTFSQENIYNAKGLLVEERKLSDNGGLVHTIGFQYNNVGNILEETKKRAGEKLDYQKLYVYDDANRPIKEETVNLDGTRFISHEYTYNNLGDLILEKWKKNNKAKEDSTKKITYDSKGLYTEMECYFASYKLFSLYKYTYEFF